MRVGVKNGGCAGMAYTMEYAEHIEAADEVVEDNPKTKFWQIQKTANQLANSKDCKSFGNAFP